MKMITLTTPKGKEVKVPEADKQHFIDKGWIGSGSSDKPAAEKIGGKTQAQFAKLGAEKAAELIESIESNEELETLLEWAKKDEVKEAISNKLNN